MKKNIWFIVCFLILHNSCGLGLYAPINEVIDPASQKNDFNLAAGFNHATYERYQIAACYSPFQNFAITYSGIYSNAQKSNSFALGLYHKLDKTSEEKYFFADFYTGFTMGKNTIERNAFTTLFVKAKLVGFSNQFYGQTGLHFKRKKIQFDLNLKLNFLDWKKFDVYEDPTIFKEFVDYNIGKVDRLFESSIRSTYSKRFHKIYLGLGTSYFNSFGLYDSGNFFAGYICEFGKIFKKNKTAKETY